MSWAEKKFGKSVELLDSSKKNVDEVLSGKDFVGIYFSAHWCPPCRGFTPNLVKFYGSQSQMEIIFVSSDSDKKSFNEYFQTMNWKALPYEEATIKAALSAEYGVRGIPSFIILNGKTGELITKDGRNLVMSNLENPAGFFASLK